MWVCVLLKALFLVLLFQTPRSIFIFKCTNLKVVYRITLIVLVIGKAQFRRAMLSCDSSCLNFTVGKITVYRIGMLTYCLEYHSVQEYYEI